MAINNMTIEQVSAVLNAIVKQATGQTPTLDTTNPRNFVTVGQTLLKTGYDPVINAITQVLSRTIFSIRPYTRKFAGLEVTAERWGNHVRKINFIDDEFEDDQRLPLTEGQSVDQWRIHKPKVVQTNFYGEVAYQRHITLFKDQLDTAFESPAQFNSFISGVLSNINDQIEQADETFDRGAIANMIAGKVYAQQDVIHLVTEYNDYLGRSGDDAYDSTTIREPSVYNDFIRWVYARIKTLTQRMSERSVKYHMLPQDGSGADLPLMRHTPADRLKMYLYSPIQNEIAARVLSDLYHDDRLQYADHEEVSYWQNIDVPDQIKANANVFDPSTGGVIETGEVTVSNVFGVLFDDEAIGTNRCSEWMHNTGLNGAGGYYNIFWHWTRRYYNDYLENAVVLLLD